MNSLYLNIYSVYENREKILIKSKNNSIHWSDNHLLFIQYEINNNILF